MTTEVQRVASRTAMAAITPRSADDTVYLTESGREGMFVWEAASRSSQVTSDPRQGVYVPPASDTTGASGAWVRRFEESVNAEWFGITGNGTTDNSDGMDALLTFLKLNRGTHGEARYPTALKVRFGLGKFYFSRMIHLKIPVIFEGITPIGSTSPATQLDFATGGFVCHRVNTAPGTQGPRWAVQDPAFPATATGADGVIFRNLYCSSRQPRPSNANYETQATDGLLAFCTVQVDNCVFDGFTRDGLSIQTSNVTGTGIDGNADMSHLEGVHSLLNGRHGIHFDGIDSNQITCRRCNVRYNNNWGIYDSGFLSNQHYDHHAAYNGLPAATIWGAASKGDTKTSVVRYPNTSGAGTDYYINPGQASAASTTTPGSNNTIWVKQLEGAGTISPDAEGAIPAWTSGIGTKDGGSYYIDSITPVVAVNLYCELSQGQPFAGALNTCFLAGDLEGNPNSIGSFMMPQGGQLTGRFGKGFSAHYRDPATGKSRAATWGYGMNSGAFFQLTDEDYFPEHGWYSLLLGGNISFGYNHATASGISFGVSGPNGGFGCPNYVRKDVTWIPRLALGANTRRVLDVDTAAPTSGNWDVGSIVFNASPSVGGKVGWVCTAAGSPGTWKAFGAIDA